MAKHGESPGRSSETVRVAEQGSLPAIHLSREEAIQRAVYAALGCTSIDWRSALKVDQAAAQIARFVEDALVDFDEPMRSALEPFAHWYDLNDCHERPNNALEVPIKALKAAKDALTSHDRAISHPKGTET